MAVFELAGYGLENARLNASCATKSPENACQPKHQLALNRRFSVIVGNHRSFEGLVILCILERRNDGLGGEAMTHGIAPRTLFAFWRCWPLSLIHISEP